jgi:hypothetical protein
MSDRQYTKEELAHLRLAREMEALLVNPGWKEFELLGRARLADVKKKAWLVCATMDQALLQNAAKGAVEALTELLDLPQSIIRVATDIKTGMPSTASEGIEE